MRELCQCYVDRVPFSNVRVGKLVNWLSVWNCLLLWVRSALPRAALRAPRRAGHCLFCCYCRTETVRLMHTGRNITQGLKINNEHIEHVVR